jgi:NAD(P) transhydrogenase
MPAYQFDLIVIGAGPAGEKGATHAASLGKKVAIVEQEAVLGGVTANLGMLPSKTLRESALCLSGYRQRGIHGLDMTLKEHVGTQDLLSRERLLRQLEQTRIRANLERHKVALVHGAASFIDPHTVRVRGTGAAREDLLTGDKILIATGSSPLMPPLFPAGHPAIFDAESFLHTTEIPRRLLIVGGGVIGTEYACIFAAFGVQVTLVEEGERLLPLLDRDVSSVLLASMRAQGIDVRLGEQVASVRTEGGLGCALASGAALDCDALLVAVGRVGKTDTLNLAAAGLQADGKGLLQVNVHCQTAQPHLYAAGDVVGFPALASSAREQALRAVSHAFLPERAGATPILPYGIYTIPECSMAGGTEESLSAAGTPWVAGVAHYLANARGQIIGARQGFLKLLFHRETLKLLGVHVVGEQAAELVHTGLLGLQLGATAQVFIDTCFNYPTLGELYKSAAQDALSRLAPPRPASSGLLKPGS